jgi:hypothetical protein
MELIVNFKTEIDYINAVTYIKNESMYYGEENNEFKCISFPVSSQEEADYMETELNFEFIEQGIQNFYYELIIE